MAETAPWPWIVVLALGLEAALGYPASLDRLERLDQAPLLEPCQRPVERPRTETDAGDLLDVVGHGVAVFLAVREADQNHQGRLREPPEIVEVFVLFAHVLRLT